MHAIAILTLVALAGSALAKSTSGSLNIIIDGVTYNGASQPKTGTLPKSIAVRGQHVKFDINPATLSVDDYILTGYPNDLRLVTAPTVVFASKTPTLSAAQLAGLKMDKCDIGTDSGVIIFRFAAGKLKYQFNDAAQGGIFQMEPEIGSAVELVHTLGESLYYFNNSFTGKINGGDGLAAVSKAEDPVNYHQMLLVKDSPQVATKTFQSGKVSKWSVTSGGRMGGVLGEDAIEFGTGATSCTSQCQAQNRIQGSSTVPPNPTSQSPLPAKIRFARAV